MEAARPDTVDRQDNLPAATVLRGNLPADTAALPDNLPVATVRQDNRPADTALRDNNPAATTVDHRNIRATVRRATAANLVRPRKKETAA